MNEDRIDEVLKEYARLIIEGMEYYRTIFIKFSELKKRYPTSVKVFIASLTDSDKLLWLMDKMDDNSKPLLLKVILYPMFLQSEIRNVLYQDWKTIQEICNNIENWIESLKKEVEN